MPFSVLGFLVGRSFAQRQGVADQSALNRVALVGGVVGTSATGLVVTTVLARREAESTVGLVSGVLVDVPDVRNSSVDAARIKLEGLGLVVAVQEVVSDAEPRTVTDQDPAPHTRVASGSTVTLFVSKTVEETGVRVPNVVGQSFADARETLQDEDFKITKTAEPSATVDLDHVIRTDPPANTLVESESRVTVVVSSGAQAARPKVR